MADDKMQSDIVQQRKDALHQQLRENQKDIGLTQEQVNDIKIQEQVDATILSKLHNSNKNDQNTLDEIADVQGRLKRDKDTEHKLESSDLALEKKRLKLDGMIVEQDLLKRGLEAQAKREEVLVVQLQGADGGTIAGQVRHSMHQPLAKASLIGCVSSVQLISDHSDAHDSFKGKDGGQEGAKSSSSSVSTSASSAASSAASA